MGKPPCPWWTRRAIGRSEFTRLTCALLIDRSCPANCLGKRATILLDGDRLTSRVERRTMAETDKSEKITINLGLVDLGQIDLLVDEGFYANRTDFIRTAIRRQLESRADAVNDTVQRCALTLGTRHLSRRELEQLRSAGQTLDLRVLGLATVADDV